MAETFASARFSLLYNGALVVLLVVPFLYAASNIRRRLQLPNLFLFASVLLLGGLSAECMFFITMISAGGAVVLSRIVGAIGIAATISALRDQRFRSELRQPDSWAPFAASAAGGFAFLALFCISLPSGASPVAFAERWLMLLPNDNVLPDLLAQHIAGHLSPKPFIGDWLSSDRPPLQAGFELLVMAFTPFLKDGAVRYQALGMLLQATSFGMLLTLCRLSGCTVMRSGGIVVLAWLSGFFLLNTEFVWPKLIAAAMLAVAMAICMERPLVTWQRAVAIGIATGLALLSHGGVVFVIPALICAFVLTKRRQSIQPVTVALVVVLILIAPWTWYQKVYDPPGDRLLKWHLAGQVAPTARTFTAVLYDAYSKVPLSSILANKVSNVGTFSGVSVPASSRRSREFFFVRDALAALVFPFVASLFFIRSSRRTLRWASRFAWLSVASLLFWAFALYLPYTSFVHVGSYMTMMLMFAAGGIVASEWPAAFVVVFVMQVYDFATVWLTSVDLSSLDTPSGCFALLVFTTICASLCASTAKSILAYSGQGGLRFGLRRLRSVATPWLPLRSRSVIGLKVGIVILVALVVPASMVVGRHVLSATRQAAVAIPAPAITLPPLSSLALKKGRASMVLDAVSVNGRTIMVGNLTKHQIFHVTSSDAIAVSGWVFDPIVVKPAAAVAVRFGTRLKLASYGEARPDVAAFFKSQSLDRVGFDVKVKGRDLQRGPQSLSLIVLSHDRTGYYINPSTVVVDLL